jgi:regulator of sirC expression with transglutaminase-like and TPR domain
MDVVRRFHELVDRPSEEVDLGRAALTFAAAADPQVDAEACLSELDRLAAGLRDFDDLRHRLFVEQHFTGAVENYDAPDHSLLHHVIERRRGIPISLSVVTMEVGRRAGVAVEGIGAPGHFLVRDPATGVLCDPYHQGAVIGEDDVQRQLATSAELGPALLPVVDAHQILARMLANLAASYRRRGAGEDLEWVLRCQRAIPGVRATAAMQLADLLSARGRFRQAAVELVRTAERVGPVEGAPLEVEARALLARLN